MSTQTIYLIFFHVYYCKFGANINPRLTKNHTANKQYLSANRFSIIIQVMRFYFSVFSFDLCCLSCILSVKQQFNIQRRAKAKKTLQ